MESKSVKLAPEMLVPRLGEHLVRKGVIDEANLQRALEYQKAFASKGEQPLLGQALIQLNLIEEETLNQAVTELIIQLRSALQSSHRNLERRVRERTAELNEALTRLSELNQMKANFISNISHELRTPLTHIKGYLELLVSESLGAINEEQNHALKVSQRSARRLEDMIEDLIMFSLASRGELSMKFVSVDLRRLISLIIKSAEDKAAERGVALTASFEDDLPLARADSEKISWALGQLIDNGIKFSKPGGRVVVAVEVENESLIQVSVNDNGAGIPKDKIKEIFEPFHQLDGSSTRHYGGTGLGLSLVRQIIEAHGSLLDVKSKQGKGSSFKFPLLIMRD